jgi:phosphoribosyl-ATP pyrophosphohydrolase
MNYEDFKANVTKWAIARKFDTDGTIEGQYLKLVEEVGEIAAAMARGDREKLIDGVGDAMVVCVVMGVTHGKSPRDPLHSGCKTIFGVIDSLSRLAFAFLKPRTSTPIEYVIADTLVDLESFAIAQGLDPNECRAASWGEIEHRGGEMRNGVFVKEGEL